MKKFTTEYVAPSGPRLAEIRRAVCAHFEISEDEIRSDSRRDRIVRPRQVGMHLARRLTNRSLREIGSQFGITDHTTVRYADSRIAALSGADDEVAYSVRAITAALEGGAA